MISFIQKYIIYILAGLVAFMFVVSGILYVRVLYGKATMVKQEAQIKSLDESVKAYAKNAEASLRAMERQQKIENNISGIKRRIDEMTPSKCLEGNDEKVFTDITWSFNNYGLSPEQCTPSKKGVPETVKTCVDNTNWTTQQVARNYEELMKSYINLEETAKCYEAE